MAFRGRGRGRGGFGGSFRRAKEESFELFPAIDDETLGKASKVEERKYVQASFLKLLRYSVTSPYYMLIETENSNTKPKSTDIERFSDMYSDKSKRKDQLSDFVTFSVACLPAELAKCGRRRPNRRAKKRVRWAPLAKDLQSLDFLDRFDERDSEDEEGKKNGSDDDEEEEEEEEGEGEEDGEDDDDDDDDYMKNEDFDDDEDDFNVEDDGLDEEGTYD